MKAWTNTRCRACGHEELRYCNVRRCRACGGTLERPKEPSQTELLELLRDQVAWIEAAMSVLQPRNEGWMRPATFARAVQFLKEHEAS